MKPGRPHPPLYFSSSAPGPAPQIRLLGLAPPAMASEAGPISKVLIVVGNPIPYCFFRFLLPKALLCSVSRFA